MTPDERRHGGRRRLDDRGVPSSSPRRTRCWSLSAARPRTPTPCSSRSRRARGGCAGARGCRSTCCTATSSSSSPRSGSPPSSCSYVAEHPIRRDRETMAGRVALDRRIQQVADVLTDPGYGRRDVQEIAGYRTLIAAPLILDDEVVGAISLWRTKVEPFDERDDRACSRRSPPRRRPWCATCTWSGPWRPGSRELARKVEQLQALNEVGETVSSTLVLDEVLLQDHPQRRAVRRVRRRLDHGVRRDGPRLPGPDHLSEQPDAADRAAQDQDRPGRDPGRPGRARGPSDRDPRHRAGRPGRPPAAAVRGRLAIGAGRPGAPRRPDHRRHGGPAQDSRATSPTRSWSSWRPSPASRRWRCSTPACSRSSSARAPSWRWPASTSRTSSPACRTSCGRR